MKILSSISEVRSTLSSLRLPQHSIGFVPTMGYLHEGHLSLIREARKRCSIVVVSIYVNPTQFGPNEDFSRYPRDIDRDIERIKQVGADIVFTPETVELYPEGFSTFVHVEGLSTMFEGEFRPTHFRGVTTVVLKLLNIVQPRRVFFGQKDIQQSVIIGTMIRDLNIDVEMDVVPTVREEDGLAMSSRNIYLSPKEREIAPVLFRSLELARQKISEGERDPEKIITAMRELIQSKHQGPVDYISIVDRGTFISKKRLHEGDSIVIPLAVRFGSTRLIDNTVITV